MSLHSRRGKLIRVTQEDIDNGCRSDTNNCPVARAIRRELEIYCFVCVGWVSVAIPIPDRYKLFIGSGVSENPQSVRKFIVRFDDGKQAKPFNFYLKFDAANGGT